MTEQNTEDNQIIPANIRVLANGAWYNMDTKRIVRAPTRGNIENQAQASELANIRWRKAQAAAVQGLRDVSTKGSSLDAWRNIVRRQAELAQDTGKGRASTEAAKFIGNVTGFVQNELANNLANSSENRLTLSDNALATIIDAIMAFKR
jgi:hypothetical protein